MNPATPISPRDGVRYGLLGLPLAFCSLPLYVLMPNLYARQWGVPLAALGTLLLVARLFDAVLDAWLGRLCDRLYARSLQAVLRLGALACVLLGLGFVLLFSPGLAPPGALLWWAGVSLGMTYMGFSALAVAHQSWGARLGGDALQRSRIVAWREGLGLLGVVLAAVTPALLGVPAMLALLVTSLAIGWWAWSRAPRPLPSQQSPAAEMADAHLREKPTPSVWRPWRIPAFRRLLAVFLLNGIATAIPATLVLFFVQDRLQAGAAMQSACLATYFLCGALSMPLWLRLVARWDLPRAWALGMLLEIAIFLTATLVGPGDALLFLLVCASSGVALGSDLALPGAMLAGVIADAGDRGRADAVYFGWWNFATKLNLALAAGLALPLLAYLGYSPGAQDAHALQVLTVAYCLLPCVFKALAALSLYLFFIRAKAPHADPSPFATRRPTP